MNEAIHKSLEVAINRFEEGDITGVMVILISYNNVIFCTAQEICVTFLIPLSDHYRVPSSPESLNKLCM